MKISYIFPVLENTVDVKTFFTDFKKKDLYKKYKEKEVFFVVNKENKKTVDYLNSLAIRNEEIKIILLDDSFSSGHAFKLCLEFITGDVTLLGDLNNPKIDVIFEKMLKKQEKGANIVQLVKKGKKCKEFFKKSGIAIYNFFVRLFTGKRDSYCVPSIQLLDKTVIDVMSVLQDKANFLRIIKKLDGINIKSVYIDEKLPVEKVDYSQKTYSLILSYIIAGIVGAAFLTILFVNIFAKGDLLGFNLIMAGIILVAAFFFAISYCKHILDVRKTVDKDFKKIDYVNLKK